MEIVCSLRWHTAYLWWYFQPKLLWITNRGKKWYRHVWEFLPWCLVIVPTHHLSTYPKIIWNTQLEKWTKLNSNHISMRLTCTNYQHSYCCQNPLQLLFHPATSFPLPHKIHPVLFRRKPNTLGFKWSDIFSIRQSKTSLIGWNLIKCRLEPVCLGVLENILEYVRPQIACIEESWWPVRFRRWFILLFWGSWYACLYCKSLLPAAYTEHSKKKGGGDIKTKKAISLPCQISWVDQEFHQTPPLTLWGL